MQTESGKSWILILVVLVAACVAATYFLSREQQHRAIAVESRAVAEEAHHRAMSERQIIEAQQAEIDRLRAELEQARRRNRREPLER